MTNSLVPLLLTLKVAGCATLAASVIGVAFAYLLAGVRIPGRNGRMHC